MNHTNRISIHKPFFAKNINSQVNESSKKIAIHFAVLLLFIHKEKTKLIHPSLVSPLSSGRQLLYLSKKSGTKENIKKEFHD